MRWVLRPVRVLLGAAFQTLAALIVLFLEWGWQPLERAVAHLSRNLVFARLEAWITSLPPYGALALFAAPGVSLFPLKLFALYLFAAGYPGLGLALIIGAKVVGTAIVAHIFLLTQPQLMKIGWFRWAYNLFVPWKEQMFAQIRASAVWRNGRYVPAEIKRWINRMWRSLTPLRQRIAQGVVVLRANLRALIKRVRGQQR